MSSELACKGDFLSTLSAALSIAWGGLLGFDVAVFVLTVYRSTRVGSKIPLIQVLVRDGKRHMYYFYQRVGQ